MTFGFANSQPLEIRSVDLVVNVFAPPNTNLNDPIVTDKAMTHFVNVLSIAGFDSKTITITQIPHQMC